MGSHDMKSLLDLYDEQHRDIQEVLEFVPRFVKAHIETLKSYDEVRKKWKLSVQENTELSNKVTSLQNELQHQMKQVQLAQYATAQVRRLLDKEKKLRSNAEADSAFFESQVNGLSAILKENVNKLSRETKEQLAMLKKSRPSANLIDQDLQTVTELESTGSIMSDLSYTRDELELNLSSTEEVREARPHKRSAGGGDHGRRLRKKRRSASAMRFSELLNQSDRVVATTTVTVDGSNVHATAVIEAKPEKENFPQPSAPPQESDDEEGEGAFEECEQVVRSPLSSNFINSRAHNFQQKAMLKSENCNVCNKRIRFSAMCLKCRDCKAVCHNTCKDKVPLPCVAGGLTPGKSASGQISDYTPLIPPMVPALVVHCINEVEARGLSEVGIYRVSGSEREVRLLVDKFKRGKGVPNLSQVPDIHVICGVLKDFLRSLKDPLTTRYRWGDFAKAIDEGNEEERKQKLYRLISSLPQPNRDTLAYLVLHLQRVAEVPDCKMPLRNLASIFGPTVIGYSSTDLQTMFGETKTGNKIMEEILSLPSDFFEGFIKDQSSDLRTPLKTPDFLDSRARNRPIVKLTILKDSEEDQVL